MELSQRNYLSGSIMLSKNEDGSSPDKYTVKSVLGEGGSTVCYEATRELSNGMIETGKLKEFYPIDSIVGNQSWYYSLERLPNGQLVPGAGTIRKFDSMCRDYIDTYRLLKKVMADNPQNEILKNYIQHGEVLYGCMDQEGRKPTVYIWSSGVMGKGFDQYLAEVKKNPTYRPEERLLDILSVVDALTDCIKALHTAGLLHMDIKPSNFMVPFDSDFGINASNISLFDINTLWSVESKAPKSFGTEGYRAPEVSRGKADNRSDIYSIGAMLFQAIVIAEEIPEGIYKDAYYSDISRLVKHSALFRASETNSDAIFMSRICKILQKCLEKNPRSRYQSCTELKEDLEKALQRLNKMIWTPVEKSKEGLSDPAIVIQKLLYEHPLYEAVNREEKNINVLVLGAGAYGQKFMDACLQAGQMAGKYLTITAVSDEAEEDKEAYFRFRPALPEFVEVDGSFKGREGKAYASLYFKSISEITGDTKNEYKFSRTVQSNRNIIKSIMENAAHQKTEYHYIFVALGEDRISRSIAGGCSDELRKQWGEVRPVCYVCQKEKKARKADLENKLYPVCVNDVICTESIVHNLEQMAFNTHMSWKTSLNIDFSKERKAFFSGEREEDRYNRTSSIAFALSIKYKLYSIHIDCTDPIKAARDFAEQVLDKKATDAEARRKFDCLVDLEHRRWVLEKVTDGWVAPRGANGELLLEECITRGSVKDSAKRTHPCLVFGSDTSPLNDEEYRINNHAKWNEGDIDPNLDELDRMSIELHRCFRRHAESVKRESLLQNADLLFVRSMIPVSCESGQRAFKQYQFALKNIINGVESYSRQYSHYQDALEEALEELTAEAKVKIKERLDIIKHAFFPVIESNLYRNYKAYDEVFIKKIPYILTYSHASSIGVAFSDGKYQNGCNEAVFGNIAAATVLCPEKISFLYYFDMQSDVDLLVRKVDAIMNYLGKRKIRSSMKLITACLKQVPDAKRERLQKELSKLKNRYVDSSEGVCLDEVKIYDVGDALEAATRFAEFLENNPVVLFDGGNQLFSSIYDNAMFIRRVTALGIPYFEFDWRNKIFTKHIGCDYLRFVKDGSFIRIHDMFALMNATDNRFHLPEFADDYEILWDIYTGKYLDCKQFADGVGSWNHLCRGLGKYEAGKKPLAKIVLSSQMQKKVSRLVFFLPTHTFTTVKFIFEKLKEYGVVEEGSELSNYTSDTCKLELVVKEEYEAQLKEVFSKPHILLEYYGIDVKKYRSYAGDCVEIRYNNLEVTDINLGEDGAGRCESVVALLEELEKAHFIYQLRQNPENPQTVSFMYSSPRIKQLLTVPGEILKVYAYYEVLKTGYFDDVACGYEFCWETGGVKNELDLILTKGFKSIIVACQAVEELKLDYYHKLHSIANQFGIGTIKVLLENTYVHSNDAVNDVNEIQRSRGTQLSIKTISQEEEIINIGQTLIQLMEAE